MMSVTRRQLKPLLHEALDRYPVMRENCLKWRDRLLKLYNFDNILNMAQAQVDGQPIPSDYVRDSSRKMESNSAAPTGAVHN